MPKIRVAYFKCRLTRETNLFACVIKHPIIMNPSYGINFDNYKQLGISKLKQRAKLIRENKNFANKVSSILDDDARDKQDLDSQLDIYPEESIYKKFTTGEDNAILPLDNFTTCSLATQGSQSVYSPALLKLIFQF